MSYCRLSDDSDVYMYDNGRHIECCICSIAPKKPVMQDGTYITDIINKRLRTKFPPKKRMIFVKRVTKFDSPQEAMEHLRSHQAAGDRVPDYAFEMLEKEIAEYESNE